MANSSGETRPDLHAVVRSLSHISHTLPQAPSHLNVMREGLSPTGGVWLHTMCATGKRTDWPS